MDHTYSKDELKEIATSLIEFMRPMHLRVFEIRNVLKMTYDLLDYIMLREK